VVVNAQGIEQQGIHHIPAHIHGPAAFHTQQQSSARLQTPSYLQERALPIGHQAQGRAAAGHEVREAVRKGKLLRIPDDERAVIVAGRSQLVCPRLLDELVGNVNAGDAVARLRESQRLDSCTASHIQGYARPRGVLVGSA